MTEIEAQRIINEHRSVCPSFVRGKWRYCVTRNGRVDVYRAVGRFGRFTKWRFESTVERDYFLIPKDVRERIA